MTSELTSEVDRISGADAPCCVSVVPDLRCHLYYLLSSIFWVPYGWVPASRSAVNTQALARLGTAVTATGRTYGAIRIRFGLPVGHFWRRQMTEPKSWRDICRIHPATDLFPMLPEDELRKLGEDIQWNGLKEPIALYRADDDKDAKDISILDGRNRLAAMMLVGLPISRGWPRENVLGSPIPGVRWIRTDPEAYVISKNILRRHLTKEQQAALIVRVMEASSTDFAKVARTVRRNSQGRVQGSTRDPIKEKVVEEGKKHGISKRTAENALAKHRGPQKAPRKEKSNSKGWKMGCLTESGLEAIAKSPLPPVQRAGTPEYEAARRPQPTSGVDDIVRKVMAFIDKNLIDKSHKTLLLLSEQLTAAIQERMHRAPKKLSRPEISGEWETINR
jgi:hypothetical protein